MASGELPAGRLGGETERRTSRVSAWRLDEGAPTRAKGEETIAASVPGKEISLNEKSRCEMVCILPDKCTWYDAIYILLHVSPPPPRRVRSRSRQSIYATRQLSQYPIAAFISLTTDHTSASMHRGRRMRSSNIFN